MPPGLTGERKGIRVIWKRKAAAARTDLAVGFRQQGFTFYQLIFFLFMVTGVKDADRQLDLQALHKASN
jgi:hypothetical protein